MKGEFDQIEGMLGIHMRASQSKMVIVDPFKPEVTSDAKDHWWNSQVSLMKLNHINGPWIKGIKGLEEFYGLGSRGWKSHNGSIVIVLPEKSFWKCIVKMFNCKQRDVRNTFPPLHKIVPPLNFVEPDSTAHRKIEPNIEVFSKTLQWKIKKLR